MNDVSYDKFYYGDHGSIFRETLVLKLANSAAGQLQNAIAGSIFAQIDSFLAPFSGITFGAIRLMVMFGHARA